MQQKTRTGSIVSGPGWSKVVPYVLLAITFVLIAFYGTAVYNFFIPTVVQQRDFSLGLSALAVIGGIAAFLSPCAFGMLPAYFAVFLTIGSVSAASSSNKLGQALRYGLTTALGMVTVAVVLAVIILALGATFPPSLRVVTEIPNPYTRALRLLAGLLLVVLGILQWRRQSIASGLGGMVGNVQDRLLLTPGTRNPWLSFYLFGMLYVLVALPCVANVMAAPLLTAFATQGVTGAVITIFLFLLTMAVLMVLVSVIIGLANRTWLTGLRSSVPMVQRVASVLMIVMGLVLIYLDLNLDVFRSLFFHFPIR